ncbi:hypothetical protein BOX15_Mlig016583g2 [Macrostomum lignano]|uniref:EF-hand domain-containing protein n=1 Tax=Macrostomum lignano TaxID=282301 RepID=A0A267GC52_9PLAT|nr:hypothetical protein BOX15_Mlig016583g2 [Macrostomum lignano]
MTISEENLRMAMGLGFDETQAKQLWRSFHYFDSDSSGAIEAGEFGNVLRLFGVDCTDAQLRDIMAEIDISSDGVISFQEFCIAARKHHKDKAERQAELRAAFEHFNEDGSGRLSREQLALALTSFGAEPLSEAELETIFQMGDRDGSGDLSIDEFVHCLTMDLDELVASKV